MRAILIPFCVACALFGQARIPGPGGGLTAIVATPTASPGQGVYTSAPSVTASDSTAGSTICYTNDGTTPTAPVPGTCSGGTTLTYTVALTPSGRTTYNFMGTKAGLMNSGVTTQIYAVDTAFVTGQTIGTLRSDFTGCVGMQIGALTGAITVDGIGRWIVAGNTATHTLVLADVSSTTLASCSLNTSGLSAAAFHYCLLATPVVLATSTTYLVYSQETSGGDQWYNDDTTVTATAGSVNTGAYASSPSGPNCGAPGLSGAGATHSFGPVTMAYR